MNKAYVLIETAVGKSRDILLELQGSDWVEFAERVTGPYDIVAMARGHVVEMESMVCDRLGCMDGVIRAVICPVTGLLQTGVLAGAGMAH